MKRITAIFICAMIFMINAKTVFAAEMQAVFEVTPNAPIYMCFTMVMAIVTGIVVYDRKEKDS
ncbi:hypothetical protein [Tannockella kyphosi]|uniref:hypothetical protein n=1 Tax=Tannockella kyphosi TaxID=2899121 RepID=UPI002011DED1|nr:hypothetical protein [Tannockella kyphosi]